MCPVECIAFMLIKGDQLLAEQRKHTKLVMLELSLCLGGILRQKSILRQRCAVKHKKN